MDYMGCAGTRSIAGDVNHSHFNKSRTHTRKALLMKTE